MGDSHEDEKELRKQEEKSAEEKQWDEKYRRDPLSALFWPFILIWAGIVFLAANLGFLRWFTTEDNPWGLGTWSLIFIGAGILVLIEVLIRLVVPEYRRPVAGTLILGLVLLGIGLGQLTNWSIIWPLILIIIGFSIIMRRPGERHRRQPPTAPPTPHAPQPPVPPAPPPVSNVEPSVPPRPESPIPPVPPPPPDDER